MAFAASWNFRDDTRKPVAVIYFKSEETRGGKSLNTVRHMIDQSKSDFALTIEAIELGNESDLESRIERLAEEPPGLIVVISPRDMERLTKIPSLYPDIRFSFVDVLKPVYLANTRSVVFKELEGAFLIGALAALHSPQQRIAFVSAKDTPRARNLAYGFMQGAKYISPDIEIPHHMAQKAMPYDDVTDIFFLLDNALLPSALHHARPKGQKLITYDDDMRGGAPDTILTSLVKRRDLALYETLKAYRQDLWAPGNIAVGVNGGYLDYSLNPRNPAQLSKATIDKAETIKDLISQRIIEVLPATP